MSVVQNFYDDRTHVAAPVEKSQGIVFASPPNISYLRTAIGLGGRDTFKEKRMTKTLLLLTSPVLFLCALYSGASGADKDAGKQMYLQYCASCHGIEGRGNGAVAKQLKIKVADLTILRKKSKGVYLLDNVMATIDGRRTVKGHGERDMPVWGEIFTREREKEKYTELTALLKAKIIAEYVATLQK
jgi:hypothetical protein